MNSPSSKRELFRKTLCEEILKLIREVFTLVIQRVGKSFLEENSPCVKNLSHETGVALRK